MNFILYLDMVGHKKQSMSRLGAEEQSKAVFYVCKAVFFFKWASLYVFEYKSALHNTSEFYLK